MRTRCSGRSGRILVATLLATVLACCGCTASGDVTSTGGDTAPSTQPVPPPSGTTGPAVPAVRKHVVTLAADGRCPRSVVAISDVANSFVGHGTSLLPPGLPTSGLVCEYGPDPKGLRHATRLDAARSRSLAAAVRAMSLRKVTGEVSCPAQYSGTVTLIALSYQEIGPVDLYYETSGCRTVDNGTVSANEIGNPSFYNGFMDAFAKVAPAV